MWNSKLLYLRSNKINQKSSGILIFCMSGVFKVRAFVLILNFIQPFLYLAYPLHKAFL